MPASKNSLNSSKIANLRERNSPMNHALRRSETNDDHVQNENTYSSNDETGSYVPEKNEHGYQKLNKNSINKNDFDIIKAYGLKRSKRNRQLSVFGLTGLIFYAVSGGPFGVEQAVSHSGPLLTLIGFILFAILWAVPEAFITAELSSAMPHNAGSAVWVTAAFGPNFGFMNAFLSWVSCVVDSAIYPTLLLSYVKEFHSNFHLKNENNDDTFLVLQPFILYVLPISLGLANLMGVKKVTDLLSSTMLLVLLPFIIMFFLAIPKMNISNFFMVNQSNLQTNNIFAALHIIFWNLNYWDAISTVTGEVKNVSSIPKSLLISVVLVTLTYILPLVTAIGVGDSHNFNNWQSGEFVKTAEKLGGTSLAICLTISSLLSNIGLLQGSLVNSAHQLDGMAELGFVPKIFARRMFESNCPVFAIVSCVGFVLVFENLTFMKLLEFVNSTYCISMIMEFAAFIYLRLKFGTALKSSYKVPIENKFYLILMVTPCMFTCLLLLVAPIMTNNEYLPLFFVLVISVIGVTLLLALNKLRIVKQEWFSGDPPESISDVTGNMVEAEGSRMELLANENNNNRRFEGM